MSSEHVARGRKALALRLGCPVWTEDRDFFGSGVATWTTDRIEIYLESDS